MSKWVSIVKTYLCGNLQIDQCASVVVATSYIDHPEISKVILGINPLHKDAPHSNGLTTLFKLFTMHFPPSLGTHEHLHGHEIDFLHVTKVVNIQISLEHAKPLSECVCMNLCA
jgi:hypothetical protein